MVGGEPVGGDTQPTSSAGTGERFGAHAGTGFYYLAVDDAGAAFERAKAADADLSSELESRDYGGREFSLRDHEGNIWSVGEYDPSRAP